MKRLIFFLIPVFLYCIGLAADEIPWDCIHAEPVQRYSWAPIEGKGFVQIHDGKISGELKFSDKDRQLERTFSGTIKGNQVIVGVGYKGEDVHVFSGMYSYLKLGDSENDLEVIRLTQDGGSQFIGMSRFVPKHG